MLPGQPLERTLLVLVGAEAQRDPRKEVALAIAPPKGHVERQPRPLEQGVRSGDEVVDQVPERRGGRRERGSKLILDPLADLTRKDGRKHGYAAFLRADEEKNSQARR